MRIRYCRTEEGRRVPCISGWCSISYNKNNLAETKDCSDDPMELNCNCIIEIESYDDLSETGYEGQATLISGGKN